MGNIDSRRKGAKIAEFLEWEHDWQKGLGNLGPRKRERERERERDTADFIIINSFDSEARKRF